MQEITFVSTHLRALCEEPRTGGVRHVISIVNSTSAEFAICVFIYSFYRVKAIYNLLFGNLRAKYTNLTHLKIINIFIQRSKLIFIGQFSIDFFFIGNHFNTILWHFHFPIFENRNITSIWNCIFTSIFVESEHATSARASKKAMMEVGHRQTLICFKVTHDKINSQINYPQPHT